MNRSRLSSAFQSFEFYHSFQHIPDNTAKIRKCSQTWRAVRNPPTLWRISRCCLRAMLHDLALSESEPYLKLKTNSAAAEEKMRKSHQPGAQQPAVYPGGDLPQKPHQPFHFRGCLSRRSLDWVNEDNALTRYRTSFYMQLSLRIVKPHRYTGINQSRPNRRIVSELINC